MKVPRSQKLILNKFIHSSVDLLYKVNNQAQAKNPEGRGKIFPPYIVLIWVSWIVTEVEPIFIFHCSITNTFLTILS